MSVRFHIRSIEFYERDVRFRMPFRFGIVTLTGAPQAFVRARIQLENGRESDGAAAELLAPKWFDKNPALTNEDNFDQLRAALWLARDAYLSRGADTAFGHWMSHYDEQVAAGAARGLNPLTAAYGPALIDRALLDAVCRALGMSIYQALRENVPGIRPIGHVSDLTALDVDAFLAQLAPAQRIAARHTVGLVDPITTADVTSAVEDGLPETLEEVVARYGHRWFKLKVAGDPSEDVERLAAIAAVLDRIDRPYHVTLDGNEQYADVERALDLWRRMASDRRLARLTDSVVFIEQPLGRSVALASDVRKLAAQRPVLIDESDDSLDAFPQARQRGYVGVSSKTCKGVYKSIVNAARCRLWNSEEGVERYFMSAEDLTIQPGIALQQDLALVSLLGIGHVEKNGHHYVNGMAGAPDAEQAAFLAAHPDLYEVSRGAARLKIEHGMVATGSLDCPGFASRVMPEWAAMQAMRR